jgi:hypothetical protein
MIGERTTELFQRSPSSEKLYLNLVFQYLQIMAPTLTLILTSLQLQTLSHVEYNHIYLMMAPVGSKYVVNLHERMD